MTESGTAAGRAAAAPVDHFYLVPGMITCPAGIYVAPHSDGPESGWFWRIEANVGCFRDWTGTFDTPDQAYAAALQFLVRRAERLELVEEKLSEDGVTVEGIKTILFRRFTHRPGEPIQPAVEVDTASLDPEHRPDNALAGCGVAPSGPAAA